MVETKSRVGRASGERCPKCSSMLLANDYGQVWCSFVGDDFTPSCNYGMTHDAACASRDFPHVEYMPHTCDCGYEEAQRDKVATP